MTVETVNISNQLIRAAGHVSSHVPLAQSDMCSPPGSPWLPLARVWHRATLVLTEISGGRPGLNCNYNHNQSNDTPIGVFPIAKPVMIWGENGKDLNGKR